MAALSQSRHLSTPLFPLLHPAPLLARANRRPLAAASTFPPVPLLIPSNHCPRLVPSLAHCSILPISKFIAIVDPSPPYHNTSSWLSYSYSPTHNHPSILSNDNLPSSLSFSTNSTRPSLRKTRFKNTTSLSISKMAYSTDQSEVSSVIDSPAYPQETPLTTPEGSIYDLADVNDLLLESMCGGTPLEQVEQTLISIARRAGDMIIAADPGVDCSDTKNNSSDRVTATDKAVEDMVSETITATYPKFEFLGEESFKEGTKLTDAPTIVADPIDGTLNFIHGFPNTAISLALTIGRKPIVGVVYNPFRGDLFTAIKGKGAFLTRNDGRRLLLPAKRNPSPIASLNDCLVAVEWGNQRSGPNWELRTSVHKKLLSSQADGGAMVHSVRSSGSAALDFCYVAAGWIDVFWEAGVWIWDICAGWIILQEAGGIVASTNPGNWDPDLEGRCYLAARGAPSGQKEVVEELWALMEGRSFTYPVKK